MKSTRLTCIAFALLLTVSNGALATTVWKWVDKDGVVHYSDQPVPGAVEVNVNAQTYDATEATIPQESNRARSQPQQSQQAAYQSIAITSPTNEQTIVGTGGAVSISASVAPGVRSGHRLQIHMDGQLVSPPDSNATSLQLNDVARGAHTVTASVVSLDGQVLIRSEPVTFYVQQPSVLRRK